MFSKIKQTILVLTLLGAFSQVNAHGRIETWTVTDHQGNTAALPGQSYSDDAKKPSAQRKKDLKWGNADGYVNVTDPELACWSTSTKSELTYPVQAGSTVTTTWKHYEYPAAVDYWPSGHAGPILEYMAACPDEGCDGFDAMQADWFKIGESIEFNGKWASLKVQADGQWSFQIPAELKKGKYLLRHEIITVHGVEGSPQIYPFCIQIDLASSGTTVPKDTYKFPNIYNEFDTTFNNFQIKGGVDTEKPNPSHEFVAPGPPIYDGSGGGNSKSKRTGTGAASNSNPGGATAGVAASAGASSVSDPYAPASAGAPPVGASSVVDPLAPTAAGVSAQAGISAAPDPYAPAVPGAPIAGASSVANPIDPAAPVPSVPIDPTAPVPSIPIDPAAPVASPPVGGPSAGDPNAPASPPPAVDAGAANPAPSIDINLSNKGVDNGAAADGAAVDKTLPAPSGGLEDANAGANTTDGVSASDSPATALAAGANAAASSVLSSPTTAPAVTGASEYASNIQGGKCHSNTWRCQTKADGTMFLDVCGNKDSSVLEWIPSNPLCPSKCDDSKPQNPICE